MFEGKRFKVRVRELGFWAGLELYHYMNRNIHT